MPNFVAYVKQRGHGCDHTVGCGNALWELKSTTRKGALAELREYLMEWPLYHFDQVRLFWGNEHEVPLEEWYSEWYERQEERKRAEAEMAERAEYERLREKYA